MITLSDGSYGDDIFTMDKANGENKSPSRRVHFLLQKNTGKYERQIMTSKEAMSLALFLLPLTTAEGDDPKPTLNKRKDNTELHFLTSCEHGIKMFTA